ncbi:MAG TPA: GNAT family N-acetyltransferase [Pyrinomonadaceae bacterium]|nr:GNAT family N-acetyltransferase [Pyrinomonadaceae bacterium]
MTLAAATQTRQTSWPAHFTGVAAARSVEALDESHREEILRFLSERPLHTVYMSGLVRDNGVQSPFNRGTFYGCRDAAGALEAVALVGHATLIEARTESSVAAIAEFAQRGTRLHMLLGEQERIEQFWHYYSPGGRAPRRFAREMLFEKSWPAEVCEPVPALRQANMGDLDVVVAAHARMAFDESGINPLETDPEGFRLRCARRVGQGRVWVVVERGRLLFKADVVSETPEVVYLEGVYVAPEERGRGLGRRCLSQLCNDFLSRAGSVALLVDERNDPAAQFYRSAGFKLRSFYDTIFLRTEG